MTNLPIPPGSASDVDLRDSELFLVSPRHYCGEEQSPTYGVFGSSWNAFDQLARREELDKGLSIPREPVLEICIWMAMAFGFSGMLQSSLKIASQCHIIISCGYMTYRRCHVEFVD